MLSKCCTRAISGNAARIQARNASTITGIKGREVIDSRGNPTVECDIITTVSLAALHQLTPETPPISNNKQPTPRTHNFF